MRDQAVRGVATEYKGVIYRSYVEAMWAVIGEEMQWDLIPEPTRDGNWIDGVYYSPDFYSMKLKMFIEIKHSSPPDFKKQQDYAKESERWIIVFIGRPNHFTAKWVNTNGDVRDYDCDFTKSSGWSRAVDRAMSQFQTWNQPEVGDNNGVLTRREVNSPEKLGIAHHTFGAGIVEYTGSDEYGNEIYYATFPGKDGVMNETPIRADRVQVISRKYAGWTNQAPARCASVAENLWTRKSFRIGPDSDESEEPWFYCRDCERRRSVEDQSVAGDDLIVEISRFSGDYYCDIFRRYRPGYTTTTKYIGLYCIECILRMESGMPSDMELSL